MSESQIAQSVGTTKAADMICVTLDVNLWSGRKRAARDKMVAINPALSGLPPKDLMTLGSRAVCDPKEINGFKKLKRKAETLLAANGLPLLGTVGVPVAKLDAVYAELVKIQDEFNELVKQFETRYLLAVEEWRNAPQNAEWFELTAEIPDLQYVIGRLSFDFHMCRVSAPSDDDTNVANGMYRKQMTGLKGELFINVAAEASTLMTKYLTGQRADGAVAKREKITWKTVRPLKRMAEKLRGFCFLDPTVLPLAEMIEHVLSLLPTDGAIEGTCLAQVWSLAKILSVPADAVEAATLAYDSGSANAFDVWTMPSAEINVFADIGEVSTTVTSLPALMSESDATEDSFATQAQPGHTTESVQIVAF